MIRTGEAMLGKTGHATENPVAEISKTALRRTQAPAEEWNRLEEDTAWSEWQRERSS